MQELRLFRSQKISIHSYCTSHIIENPLNSLAHNSVFIDPNNFKDTLREWRCDHQECTSSSGMGMYLTVNGVCLSGNAHPHREWRCFSSGIGICLTRNVHPHRKWGCASPGMGMCLTGNAYSHRKCT